MLFMADLKLFPWGANLELRVAASHAVNVKVVSNPFTAIYNTLVGPFRFRAIFFPIDAPPFVTAMVGNTLNVTRLILAGIFVGSFFMRPLKYPISLLWRRIVESDKPIFTMVFGGAAAVAKGVEEVVALL